MYIRYQVDGMLFYKTPPNRWKKNIKQFFYIILLRHKIVFVNLVYILHCVSIDVLFMVGQNFFRLPLLLILLHSLFPFKFFCGFFFGLINFSNSFISFIKTSSILVLSSLKFVFE